MKASKAPCFAWVWAICLLLVACANEEPTQLERDAPVPRAEVRPNVFVILVDTLRADRMSTYGYERQTTPNIDRFAADSVIFTNSRSQASCTYPSVNSLLTSRAPEDFIASRGMAIPSDYVTMAQLFSDNGYGTLAVSASPIVRAKPSRVNKEGGYGAGFDSFDHRCTWKDAACVNERLFHHLDRAQAPYFGYIHYMDPHGPYAPPETHERTFAAHYQGSDERVRSGNPKDFAQNVVDTGVSGLDEEQLQHLSDLYDEEILYFDSQFQSFLDGLSERGILDQSIIVMVSDHGESFMEHGFLKHCYTLYDTEIRTPMIWRVPGVQPARRSVPSQNLDVLPTLADFLVFDTGRLEMAGRSLRVHMAQELLEEETLVFSSQFQWRSVADNRYKLMLNLSNSETRLYDYVNDPAEVFDVADRRVEVRGRLIDKLTARLEAMEGVNWSRKFLDRELEAKQKLKAVGYLQ